VNPTPAGASPSNRDNFEILGELGSNDLGPSSYLARDRKTGELVAIQITDLIDTKQPVVSVKHTLNSSVPATNRHCHMCKAVATDWRRYCANCGADLSGADLSGSNAAAILERATSGGKTIDLLGEMPRSEGGGKVYFGAERNTGQIVALDLRKAGTPGGGSGYSLDVTSTLRKPTPADQTSEPIPPTAGHEVNTRGGAATKQPKVCPACAREFDASIRFCPDDGSVLRPMAHVDDMIGEVIAERYHIIEKIGQGGMGQVYVAEHVRMGRRCALKVMYRNMTQDTGAVSRFAREAANASRINSDNVAHIYDFGETKEHGVYIAMELVHGEPLSKIIDEQAPLPLARALSISSQVANALAAAHRAGVVHRDVKPNNIVVGRGRHNEDLIKVVDFGIAKAVQDDEGGKLTRTGFVVGTPRYMSPEQLILEPVDGRSDMYSLGCIMFELVVGTHPFGSSTGPEQYTRRLIERPPVPSSLNQAIPPELDAIILKTLALRPEERYETADDLREALDEVIATLKGVTPRKPIPATVATNKPVASVVTPSAPTPSAWESLTGPKAGSLPAPVSEERPVVLKSVRGRPSPRIWLIGLAALILVTVAVVAWQMKANEETVVTRNGSIRVAANLPLNTSILVNGEPKVLTNSALSLLPGAYTIELSAAGYAPLRETIEVSEARETVWSPKLEPIPPPRDNGSIRITTRLPANTSILVNGEARVLSGNALSLSPGAHTIELSAVGYQPVRQTLQVAASKETTWAPELVRERTAVINGTVRVATRLPPNTSIRVDGQARVLSNNTLSLPAGARTIDLSAPGYLPLRERVEITAAKETSWSPVMTPESIIQAQTGSIRLTTRLPANASIRINGESRAFSENVLSLPPGTYNIELSAPGYQLQRDRIQVTAGKETEWSPVLEAVRPAAASFAEVVTGDMANFKTALETRNFERFRFQMTTAQIAELRKALESVGPAGPRIMLGAPRPDSTQANAIVRLRIDDAQSGRTVFEITEFVATYERRDSGWRMLTFDKRR
jgi:serine/threonine protein kinase